MVNFRLCVIMALSLPALSAYSQSEPSEKEPLKAVDAFVYYCHDGDTCRVKIADAVWTNVRLAGIDAPEVGKGRGKKKGEGQPLGNEARDFLNTAVKGKTLKLRQTDLDQYNRLVVELLDGDKVVNLALIENGFAEAYKGKAKRLDKAPYFAAEEKARKEKKGVWGLAGYQSPSDYRQTTK